MELSDCHCVSTRAIGVFAYAWGADHYGQLGVKAAQRGEPRYLCKPQAADSLADLGVTQVACGTLHSACVSGNASYRTEVGAN